MPINHRKKNSRQRASHTQGGGSKKKHRGAGNRGGKGRAGSGKKGDCKKTMYWKERPNQGRYGFTSINPKEIRSINLTLVEDRLGTWVTEKKVDEKNGVYSLDLGKLGYQKLLSTGTVKNKLNITVNAATPKAIEKVSAAGGVVEVPGAEE